MTTNTPGPDGVVTTLLRRIEDGDLQAREELFSATADDLRNIARNHIMRSQCNHSIGATSLLQDAVVRILRKNGCAAENRAHFFYIMKRALRDVLVERLRASDAGKRGGGWTRVPLMEIRDEANVQDIDGEELSHALDALEAHNAASAEAFLLIDLYGATLRGAAETLQRTLAQVRGDRDYAHAWLMDRLRPSH